MASIINAVSGSGITSTADGSGIIKIQSNSVTTNALAWVNFNGTGTVAIRSSYNVSSITDNGTGDYTVNFATAMPDANYVGVSGAAMRPSLDSNCMIRFSNSMGQYPITTTTYRFMTSEIGTSPVGQDATIVQIAFFGN